MNLLFIHDIKALINNGRIYARSYGITVWKRYLSIFNDILVCTRSHQVSSQLTEGVDLLSSEHVRFDDRVGMFKGPEVFFSKRIKKILRENIKNSDGIIIRLDSFLGLLGIKECIRQNKPFVTEVVGCAWDSFWNHGISGKILAPFMFLMMKNAVRKSPYTIYVTKQFLQNRYPTKGINTNISNVDLPIVDKYILADRLKRISNLDSTSKLHLMTTANVGVRYKGFQYVIKALGRIKKEYGDCQFIYHIVGEGDQSYLREIASKENVADNIIFHGALSHSQVFEQLKDIDIYIQPSLQEGLPRAMIEAMSYGLPCIGTDVAGIPELINSDYIYKRNKNMPKQIASLLRNTDKEKLLKEAKTNFESAKDYYSPILNARRTEFLRQYAKEIQTDWS